MQPALHRDALAAEREHLLHLLVDGLERQQVAVARAQRAIDRAERTVLSAEVGVVDVAIDLIGGNARVVLLLAHLARGHADAHQVIGAEHLERFLWRDAHRLVCPILFPLPGMMSGGPLLTPVAPASSGA